MFDLLIHPVLVPCKPQSFPNKFLFPQLNQTSASQRQHKLNHSTQSTSCFLYLLLELSGLLFEKRGLSSDLCTPLGLLLQVLDLSVEGSRSECQTVTHHITRLCQLPAVSPAILLLLVLLDQAFGFAVLALQGLILRLRLLQVLVHRLAQALSLHPVALQLLHPLLVLLQGLLQLGLVHSPALLLLLRVMQLERQATRLIPQCFCAAQQD